MKYLLLLLVPFGLISCASTDPTNSGFLAYPSQLSKDGNDLRFRKDGFEPSSIKQVYIAPVELRLTESKLSAALQNELKEHYQQQLHEAFAAHFQVVKQPSAKAHTLRSAITKFDTVNVATNAVLSIVAVSVDNGGASVESELIKNQDRFYAEARSVVGGLSGSGSFASKTVGYLSKTRHTKSALTTIAKDLADQMIRG